MNPKSKRSFLDFRIMKESRSVVIKIIRAGREKSCLKREWVLLFLRMQCSIFGAIYLNPLTPSLSPLGRGGC
jgi:hypothetical protein